MACPTCDHTMHPISLDVFWCPRCGTIRMREREKTVDDGVRTLNRDEVPMLVKRITEFAGILTDEHEELIREFERLGVRESIMLPGP